jgi:hypothetical protein
VLDGRVSGQDLDGEFLADVLDPTTLADCRANEGKGFIEAFRRSTGRRPNNERLAGHGPWSLSPLSDYNGQKHPLLACQILVLVASIATRPGEVVLAILGGKNWGWG